MGVQVSKLPQEHQAEMTRILRKEFDRLTEEGHNDEYCMTAMKAKYEKFIHDHAADLDMGWERDHGHLKRSPSKRSPKSKDGFDELAARLQIKTRQNSGLMKDNHPYSPPKRASPTRRKSFAPVHLTPIREAPQIPIALAESASEPILSTPALIEVPPGMDSWDSVTEQPFCNVCQMAFKSIAALDRHVKFSELHEKVLKKRVEDYEKSIQTVKDLEPLEVEQIEGIHYKLLYSGRKLFWRTQESVDFSFYLHFDAECVEVIAFSVQSESSEVNRVYLDYSKLMQINEELLAKAAVDSKELKMVLAQPPMLRDEYMRKALTTYILTRLGAEDDGKPIYAGGNKVIYKPAPSDPLLLNPRLESHPSTLYPVRVHARRRSSTEEIDQAILGLVEETDAVARATHKAQMSANDAATALDVATNIAVIVTEAVDILETNKEQIRVTPTVRWQHAIKQVRRNLMVDRFKVVLSPSEDAAGEGHN